MDWKKLVSIAVFLFFASCISFYPHPKGGFRPKKPNFSLAKEKFKYNKLIDTVAIYNSIDTIKYGEFKSIMYIKFYNNGRQFISTNDIENGLLKLSIRPLEIGFYKTNGNNLLLENFIVDPLNKYKTEYVRQQGKIKGDTIFLNNIFIKGDKDIYVKQKLDFIPEPSNW